ncbi:hypothetical protein A4D02_10690 [Niastella koreensis]|uniref:Beta-lactamase-inhibitor-like PepSY-like domain-containing protein n=2 Tax=Niastella koreensis TaxID=354356 RepID=G8T6Z6_NIAKG|nr:hypothetical protein [Niastella koreensis]AEV99017.1 hypothetical protein Niako_2678 [Niastella koreensis GR20-10]OQP43935.1 hypothetical protein A4D02_10690 [Niastella koreensis]
MKRSFLLLTLFCALCLVHVAVHAQPDVKEQDLENNKAFQRADALPNSMATFRDIPIKAVRSFKNSWQYVDNESWYKVPDGYRARFIQDGVLYLITYNKRGNWLNSMRQYDETVLDREVRSAVKTVYYDYSIMLVEEIALPMKPLTYIIHMEDKTSFLNVGFRNGEMVEMTEINKL